MSSPIKYTIAGEGQVTPPQRPETFEEDDLPPDHGAPVEEGE